MTRPVGVPRTKRATVDERARAVAQGLPVQRPPVRYHGPTPEELRLDAAGRTEVRRFSTLGPALLTTAMGTLGLILIDAVDPIPDAALLIAGFAIAALIIRAIDGPRLTTNVTIVEDLDQRPIAMWSVCRASDLVAGPLCRS